MAMLLGEIVSQALSIAEPLYRADNREDAIATMRVCLPDGYARSRPDQLEEHDLAEAWLVAYREDPLTVATPEQLSEYRKSKSAENTRADDARRLIASIDSRLAVKQRVETTEDLADLLGELALESDDGLKTLTQAVLAALPVAETAADEIAGSTYTVEGPARTVVVDDSTEPVLDPAPYVGAAFAAASAFRG